MTQSHHLVWECVDPLCLYADITIKGICLDIDYTVIYMCIYNSTVYDINPLHIGAAMLDGLVHELTFLSHRLIHCLPFGLIVLTRGHRGDCGRQRHY